MTKNIKKGDFKMKINKRGLAIIKKYEGCRLTAYKCPAGVYTIGYGHTKGVKKGDTITQQQADLLLAMHMALKNRNKNERLYTLYFISC